MRLGAFVFSLWLSTLSLSALGPSAARAQGRVSLGPVRVSGPVPVAEARSVLTAAQRSFQQCYDDRLRQRAGLAGRAVTRVFVASDGAPITAQVDESNLGDAELEGCIKRAAMVLEFSENARADSHVRFELRFGNPQRPSGEAHTVTAGPDDPRFRASGAAGGAREPGPPAALRAQVHPEVIDISGARPEEQIASGLRRAAPRIRACYERSLSRDSSLAGELRVRFVVNPGGRAGRVHFEENRVGDPSLTQCIGRVVATTRFARGARGPAEVVARLRLRPPEGLTNERRGRRRG